MRTVISKQYIVVSLILISMFLLSTIYYLLATPVLAQSATEYKLLTPLPNVETAQGTGKATASSYISGLFNLIIGIAGVLAVIKIIFGGIKYMSTDAFMGKNEARDTIQNAIWGLILAISAWLILFTVNPNLVKFDLKIPVQTIPTPPTSSPTPSPTPSPGGGAGRPMTSAEIADHERIKTRLESAGVQINNNGQPCTQGQTRGCTNLNGLAEAAIQGLVGLKSDCNCVIQITGGTESGHQTHGVGRAIVDLSNDSGLRNWMTSKGFLINNGNGAVVTLSNGRRGVFVFERAGQGNSTGDHWHVVF